MIERIIMVRNDGKDSNHLSEVCGAGWDGKQHRVSSSEPRLRLRGGRGGMKMYHEIMRRFTFCAD